MSQRAKRQHKRPRHLNEYVLETNNHSKYSEQAKSALECSDEGDENITFIPPKPKIAKLNKVVNPMVPNLPNAGALVDRGTPNEGFGIFNTHGGVPTLLIDTFGHDFVKPTPFGLKSPIVEETSV